MGKLEYVFFKDYLHRWFVLRLAKIGFHPNIIKTKAHRKLGGPLHI